jgi:hypothetical protein
MTDTQENVVTEPLDLIRLSLVSKYFFAFCFYFELTLFNLLTIEMFNVDWVVFGRFCMCLVVVVLLV